MTFLEMAKVAMPGATNDEADFALWNHTPFPFETSPRILFKKLRGYHRACKNGLRLCELCSNKVSGDAWNCDACEAALAKFRG